MVKNIKRRLALIMAITTAVTSFSMPTVQAAKKTISLNKTKLSLTVGESKQLKLKNPSGLNIKSVTWSVTKGNNVIKLSKKTKKPFPSKRSGKVKQQSRQRLRQQVKPLPELPM